MRSIIKIIIINFLLLAISSCITSERDYCYYEKESIHQEELCTLTILIASRARTPAIQQVLLSWVALECSRDYFIDQECQNKSKYKPIPYQ